MRSILSILVIYLFFSCESEYTPIDSNNFINLKWNKAYEDDSIEKALIGLKWALSYVGANTPDKKNGLIYNKSIIKIDCKVLGFSKNARKTLSRLISRTKTTEEYNKNNSVDLGRFVTLILGSSEHYYQLVETPETLEALKLGYKKNAKQGYINNSSVALQDREIIFSEQKGLNQIWISEEKDSITNEIYEFETIELLENGQLRFGIYDEKGKRKNVANKKHTNAGKPAKCIWCHESNLNQMFKKQLNNPIGYLTEEELQQKIITSRDSFHLKRKLQKDNIDYSKRQQHTYAELLYISFLEPSIKRLSLEFQMSEKALIEKLNGLKTHKHKEFSFLGNIYYRREIEKFNPLKSIEVSESVRELSTKEINHLSSGK